MGNKKAKQTSAKKEDTTIYVKPVKYLKILM